MPRRSFGTEFRALLAGSFVSNIGDGIRLAALPLLATELTSSALVISIVTAAQYLPWVTFAPLGGVVVDRSDRRRLIVVTQLWRAAVMIGLFALVAGGVAEVWHVCVVAFLITVGEIMVDPAVFATVPQVVEDQDLEAANGRVATVELVTNDFAGGPVGSLTFAAAPWLPFLIDGLSYLGSAPLFARLRPGQRAVSSAKRSVRAEARKGLDFLLGNPVLGRLLVGNVIYFFAVATRLSLLVVLVTSTLDESALAFGLVLVAGAAGAVAGSRSVGVVRARVDPRLALAGSVALQAVAVLAMAVAPSLWILLAVTALHGVPVGIQRPVAQAIQQRLTPNDILGRVNVTSRMFTRGTIVIGAVAAGVLAEAMDVRTAFAVSAGLLAVSAAVISRALVNLERAD